MLQKKTFKTLQHWKKRIFEGFKQVGKGRIISICSATTNTHFMGKHIKFTIYLRDVTFKSFELIIAVGLLKIYETLFKLKEINYIFVSLL